MESIRSSCLADSVSSWSPFPLPPSFLFFLCHHIAKWTRTSCLWALNPFFSLPYSKHCYCEAHYRSKVTDWEKALYTCWHNKICKNKIITKQVHSWISFNISCICNKGYTASVTDTGSQGTTMRRKRLWSSNYTSENIYKGSELSMGCYILKEITASFLIDNYVIPLSVD